jgi:hypothetical protein
MRPRSSTLIASNVAAALVSDRGIQKSLARAPASASGHRARRGMGRGRADGGRECVGEAPVQLDPQRGRCRARGRDDAADRACAGADQIPRERGQAAAISGRDSDGNSRSHPPDSHVSSPPRIPAGIQMSGLIHCDRSRGRTASSARHRRILWDAWRNAVRPAVHSGILRVCALDRNDADFRRSGARPAPMSPTRVLSSSWSSSGTVLQHRRQQPQLFF